MAAVTFYLKWEMLELQGNDKRNQKFSFEYEFHNFRKHSLLESETSISAQQGST